MGRARYLAAECSTRSAPRESTLRGEGGPLKTGQLRGAVISEHLICERRMPSLTSRPPSLWPGGADLSLALLVLPPRTSS